MIWIRYIVLFVMQALLKRKGCVLFVKTRKCLSIIMALVMIFCVIAPTAAVQATEGTITKSYISADTILVNDSIVLTGVGADSNESYTYAFYYKRSDASAWTTLHGYSEVDHLPLKLTAAGSYDICIKVKNSLNSVTKEYFAVTVVDGSVSSTSYVESSRIDLGDSVNLVGVGIGGTAPYTYAFFYKLTDQTKWTCRKGFSSTDKVAFTPTAAGTYDICIKVRDAKGAEHKKYFTLEAANKPLTGESYLSSSKISRGSSIQLTGAASGGTAPYQYAFFYKKAADTAWTCRKGFSSTDTVSITPDSAGTYDVCIKALDANKAQVKEYFTLKVIEPLRNESYIDKDDIVLGEGVTLKAVAADGEVPYQYAFYWKNTGTSKWITIQGYDENDTVTLTPEAIGTYDICIKVSGGGVVEKQYFTLTVTNELTNRSSLSDDIISLGDSITLNAIALGGEAPYQYAFYYKRAMASSWTTASDYITTDTISITPEVSGEYDACIKVKDSNNTVVKQYYSFIVDEDGITVHFYNYDNWDRVMLYYYDENGEYAPWCGSEMTAEGDGWYSRKLWGYESANVVFNDGADARLPEQAADSYEVSGNAWYRNGTWTDTRPEDIVVYFYKPTDWSAANIYYYLNDNDTGPEMPGAEMTEISDGWYEYTITRYSSAKVRFNNGQNAQIPSNSEETLDAEGMMWYKDGIWCDSESDRDEDQLPDCYELISGTNVNAADSDGDFLPDGYEVLSLGTDPLLADSDGNGTNDADEDADGDGLNNLREYQLGTDPLSVDSDGDGLADYDELTVYQTDPANEDTDGDGANDGWEIANGFDPTEANESFEVTVSAEESEDDGALTASVTANTSGGNAASIKMSFVESTPLINESIPGYMGQAVEITSNEDAEGAELTFTFDESLLEDDDFEPVIYYYDEENQIFEEVETTVTGNTASATLGHFSYYVLMNKFDFNAFNVSMLGGDWLSTAKKVNMEKIHVALVVDCDAGHVSDKWDSLKNALKNIVYCIDDRYEVTIVKNTAQASAWCDFTGDKDELNDVIDGLTVGVGMAAHEGIRTAVDMFDDCDEVYTNVIVLLMSGNDTDSVSYEEHYAPLVEKIQKNDIALCAVTLNNANASLLAHMPSGTVKYGYNISDWSTLSISNVGYGKGYVDNFITDANSDGIIDTYAAKFARNGTAAPEITYTTGAEILFDKTLGRLSYSELQNKGSDYDHDGLINGEELTIYKGADGTYKAKIYSNLLSADSDGDGLLDAWDPKPLSTYNNGTVREELKDDDSEAVIIIQKCLEYLGYLDMMEEDGSRADYGKFGGKTAAAFKLFQLNYGFSPLYYDFADYIEKVDVPKTNVDELSVATLINVAVNNGFALDEVNGIGKSRKEMYEEYCNTAMELCPKKYREYISNISLPLTDIQKAAGVSVRLVNSIYYYDYTKPIYDLMEKNARQCESHSHELFTVSWSWFCYHVNHGAIWDIKRSYRWYENFHDCGLLFYDPQFEFYYDDMKMTSEDSGNMTYGYWGNATGIGNFVLLYGGDVAVFASDVKDKNLLEIMGQLYLAGRIDSVSSAATIGILMCNIIGADAQSDKMYISLGYALYFQKHPDKLPKVT